MKYESTRGKTARVTAAEAIKMGIAPDGGLFVPEKKIGLTPEQLSSLQALSYQERAREVLRLFLADFTDEEITRCVYGAYSPDKFESPEIAPVVKLAGQVYLLELWHGPTCAFKDMALQMLPLLLTTSTRKTGENAEIAVLVATSGDTGKAALEGFRDVPGTRIIVFYPDEGVSQIQERQMITQEGNNVHVVAVKGNFDDAQNGVKSIFGNAGFARDLAHHGMKLSSANSINWGRLVPQIIYYISAYLELLNNGEIKEKEPVNVVVPTGNFGNILAAYYAREMGLPFKTLICAANTNNVLTDFINTGLYDRNRAFHKTISPSMDILISSNLERLLYEVTGHAAPQVDDWMAQLRETGRYQVDSQTLAIIREVFWSDFATDQETMETIRDTYQACGYLLDTHTAVGKRVYDKYVAATGDRSTTVIASTASPFKFASSVATAVLGADAVRGRDEFALLDLLSATCGIPVPGGLQDLGSKPVRHLRKVERDGMAAVVRELLGIG
ncbi:MAG: threonine synthase [Syntrophomonadaceae bacterium]|nr:threonine synthase [Syntrophomonadaceae bacterium]